MNQPAAHSDLSPASPGDSREGKQNFDVVLLVTTLGGGGTERYAKDLAVGFTQRGIRCLVVADSEPLSRLATLEEAGVSVKVLGVDRQWSRRRYIDTLSEIFRDSGAQVINAHTWARGEWQVLAAEKAGIPIIRTHHHTFSPLQLNDWLGINRQPFWLYRMRHFARRHPVPIICVARLALPRLRRVLGNGFPAGAVHSLLRVPPEPEGGVPPPAAPAILWIGQFVPRKRPGDALRVFELVQRMIPDVRLVMLGTGPLHARIAKRAAAISPHIEVVGYTTDIWSYIRRSRVSLQTSELEGLSHALVEAMGCGLPAVATSAGATAEVVIDGVTGYIAPIGDVEKLAAGITKLLGNPDLYEEMSQRVRQLAAEEFSVEATIEGTLNLYTEFCSFRRP